MILVTLGTQDKQFKRILEAIDKAINNKVITEEVIVQSGCTNYKSKNMKIFDLIPIDKFEELVEKCDLLITHGGVGSITLGLKKNKKVIAVPRLKEYDEHENNHQQQIVNEFSNAGYILKVDDMKDLEKIIKETKKFKPKKFKSNTKKFIDNIEDYIKEEDNTSWYNKYRILCENGYIGIILTLINILIFSILFGKYKILINIIISFLLTLILNIIINFILNMKINKKNFITIKVINLILDLDIMYIAIKIFNFNPIYSKYISSFLVLGINIIIIKYIFNIRENKNF